MTAPLQATRVTGLSLSDFAPPPSGVADPSGAWVVDADGVYLFKDSSFQRVDDRGKVTRLDKQ